MAQLFHFGAMKNQSHDDAALVDAICDLALEAGAKALEIYHSKYSIEEKDDASPVTDADRLCEEIILKGLRALAPEMPILAEESASEGRIPVLGEEFFLVDPLDGTKEFIKKTGEFTVNIALIRKQRPMIGVVYAPALGQLYAGALKAGAWSAAVSEDGVPGRRQVIKARAKPQSNVVAVASRSHRSPETEAYLAAMNIDDFVAAGSSLKFCLIAEGSADIYPRFGRTMEWDTGAGQAVLEAAGGKVLTYPDGTTLGYGKKARGFDNPFFVASGADGA